MLFYRNNIFSFHIFQNRNCCLWCYLYIHDNLLTIRHFNSLYFNICLSCVYDVIGKNILYIKFLFSRYKRYVNFERRSNPRYKSDIHIVMTVSSAFTIDSSIEVIPPTVSKASKEIYNEYVQRTSGKITVPPSSKALYEKYVNFSL